MDECATSLVPKLSSLAVYMNSTWEDEPGNEAMQNVIEHEDS